MRKNRPKNQSTKAAVREHVRPVREADADLPDRYLRINDVLTEKEARQAKEASDKGQLLRNTYPRISEAELTKIVTEVVRMQEKLTPKLTPSLRWKLTLLVSGFVLGVMQNATWDLLKHFIPYINTFFMSAEVDQMEQAQAAYKKVRDLAPPEFSDFAPRQSQGLFALRAQTWRKLQDEIQRTELNEVLREMQIRYLLGLLENRLFLANAVVVRD